MPGIVSSQASPVPPVTSTDTIDAALLCCAKAREAAGAGRFNAANGLLQTAISLHGCAESQALGSNSGMLLQRYDQLVNDLCFCAQTIEVEAIARQAKLDGASLDGASLDGAMEAA